MNARHALILCIAMLLAACGGGISQPQSLAPSMTLPPAPTGASAAQPSAAPEPTSMPAAPSAPAVEPTSLPAPAATPATEPTVLPSAIPDSSGPGELLFLRKNALIALNLGSRAERELATNVADFAVAPDHASIALIRFNSPEQDVWLVGRDGNGLRQLTSDGNQRLEATISWAPDGQAIAFASSASPKPYARTWLEWSAWCAASQVQVLALGANTTQNFGPGCDPAIAPDGKRIAYATPPTAGQEGMPMPNGSNAIRLVNRQGQNGWNFASATSAPDAPPAKQGLLVYAPAWSPDGTKLTYQRFIGYRVLVDMAMTEIGGSFEGKGQALNDGAGWLLPAQFAPGGNAVAVAENNFSDARGFGGYDNWSVSVLQLAGTHEIALPEGSVAALGQPLGALPRAQSAAWAPAGGELAVLLPTAWKPGLSQNEPFGEEGAPGEIWRWTPGQEPAEQLATQVDFASPLAWLPG